MHRLEKHNLLSEKRALDTHSSLLQSVTASFRRVLLWVNYSSKASPILLSGASE